MNQISVVENPTRQNLSSRCAQYKHHRCNGTKMTEGRKGSITKCGCGCHG